MTKGTQFPANPVLLKWARTSAGLTLAEVAKSARVKEEKIAAWENGSEVPGIGAIKKLAHIYRRPTAVFLLANPPDEGETPKDFRSAPHQRDLSREARFAIRQVLRNQALALDLRQSLGREPVRLTVRIDLAESPEVAGARLRGALGVTVEEQTKWKDPNQALRTWKRQAEKLGCLVFQLPVSPKRDFRGASFWSEEFPAILISAKDAPNGRIFTLAHELAHLALRSGGLCDLDDADGTNAREVETFCNRVAACLLLPEKALLASLDRSLSLDHEDSVAKLAKRFRVSTETMLRRLYSLGRVNHDFYRMLLTELRKRPLPSFEGGGGPPPSVLAIARRGESLSRLVLQGYDEGAITITDASEALGTKVQQLVKIRKLLAGEADE